MAASWSVGGNEQLESGISLCQTSVKIGAHGEWIHFEAVPSGNSGQICYQNNYSNGL